MKERIEKSGKVQPNGIDGVQAQIVPVLINTVFGKIAEAIGGTEGILPKSPAWTGFENMKLSGKSGVS